MNAKAFNPRSLSLKAGLNPTAVRDMLEGRVKFPRYDTVEALAQALETTPARLMTGASETETAAPAKAVAADKDISLDDDDLNLLTEIITRLQETAEEYRSELAPQDFAAMVTTIYRQIAPQNAVQKKAARDVVGPRIKDLMDYERLRRRAGQKS